MRVMMVRIVTVVLIVENVGCSDFWFQTLSPSHLLTFLHSQLLIFLTSHLLSYLVCFPTSVLCHLSAVAA